MSNEALWPGNVGPPNNITSETPESPPLYEKTLFNRPREYNDTQIQEPILSSVGDVDHRYAYFNAKLLPTDCYKFSKDRHIVKK